MTARRRLALLAALALGLSVPTPARQIAGGDERLLPPPRPLTADSPMDSIYYADRVPYGQQDDEQHAATAGTVRSFTIPAGPGGTGTFFAEPIRYQIPDDYDPEGPPRPLVVAYHGYGSSANSVSNQSAIDEECNARGWFYLSPTGLDDQLFGTPICQQHISVAIQWMLDGYNIDPDRIYMVGWSMGAGIVTSYACRHRDPDGIMIAALGCVSGTFDWTLTYERGLPDLQAVMENPYNFGGSPAQQPFAYKAVSSLFFAPPYPPGLDSLDLPTSMGTNLHDVPVYIVFDEDDPIVEAILGSLGLRDLIQQIGGTLSFQQVSGTADPGPPVVPAPHSWLVLDEADLFDFFEPHSVVRRPADFQAQQAASGVVSWVRTVQDDPQQFVYVDGRTGPEDNLMAIDVTTNASELELRAGDAGLTGWPARVEISNDDVRDVRVRLTGFEDRPSRLIAYGSPQTLIPLVDSDPANDALLKVVDAGSDLAARVWFDPQWTTTLTITPERPTLFDDITIDVDGPASSAFTWLLICELEQLALVEGVWITAFPVPPALVLFDGLDANGDLSLPASIPGDPILQGVRLPTQAVTATATGTVESVSNHWGFYID